MSPQGGEGSDVLQTLVEPNRLVSGRDSREADPTDSWCHACGNPRTPGELLLAVWPNGQAATVCRPDRHGSRCLAWAAGARITLLDPAAAAAFDRLAAVPAGRP